MNISEDEIERLLRAAPEPVPPRGLKERLVKDADCAVPRTATRKAGNRVRSDGGWFRRWWPALAPAAVTAACAVVLTTQQIQIQNLQQTVSRLSGPASTAPDAQAQTRSQPVSNEDLAARTAQEITRLRETGQQLQAEIAALQKLQKENEQLRAQLAAPPAAALSAQEAEALALAAERAKRIQCVNNLKQLGLAAKIWALDHQEMFPAEVLQMTNEIPTPKIVYCPADTGRQPASSWNEYTQSNCSYEFLGASASDREEPTRVLFRCPIHGNVGLCDGSVQGGVAKTHPEAFVERDGKLYFEPKAAPAPQAGASESGQGAAAAPEQGNP